MEERPQLAELENQIITNEWFNLGLQLGLTDSDLKYIQVNHFAISDCRREMFSLWLKRFPGACRNHIIEGLKTNSVGEILIAERYTLFISQSSCGMCKLFNHCICKINGTLCDIMYTLYHTNNYILIKGVDLF